MLGDPLQSSRCPAIPEKSSFRSSQSSRNRDLNICNPDDCDWILNFERSCCNSDGLRSDWIGFVPTPIAPGLRFESPGWGPDPGPLSGGSSAILEMPRNPRNCVLALFAILAQSCGLWIDCRFKAILTQFRRIATNCHCNRHPGLRQYFNQTEIGLEPQDGNSDRNPHNRIELR